MLRLKKKDKGGASADAGNGGGGPSAPAGEPVAANEAGVPPATGGKPGEMQMTIAHGELPNLIQYLSTSIQNTGCLTLYAKDVTTVVGRLFFREGHVYYARNKTSVGVEAVARLIHEVNDTPAVFDTNGTIEEQNIAVATSNLLVEAIVYADELALTEPQLVRGEKGDLIDEFMGQKRIELRLLTPEEKAAMEQAAAEKGERPGAGAVEEAASPGAAGLSAGLSEGMAEISASAKRRKRLGMVIGLAASACLAAVVWLGMWLLPGKPGAVVPRPPAPTANAVRRPVQAMPSVSPQRGVDSPVAKQYFILDDGSGPGSWGIPCSPPTEKLLGQLRSVDDRAAAESLVAAVRRQGDEYWGGMEWAMAVRLLEAEQAADARDPEDCLVEARWTRVRQALENARISAQSRRTAAYTAVLERARAAAASERWAAAVHAYEEILALPGFSRDPAARRGVQESRYRIVLATAEAAAARGDWERVWQEAKLASELVPGSIRARDLLLQARLEQVPWLVVRVWADGVELKSADITMNGMRFPDAPLPATYRVEQGKSYAFSVNVPPAGDRCYAPQQWNHAVDRNGRLLREVKLSALAKPMLGAEWVVPGIRIGLAPVSAGRFQMGSEDGKKDEMPVHAVTITHPLWVGRTEVTNGQYRQFVRESGYDGGRAGVLYLQHLAVKKSRTSEMPVDDDCPVCYVNWNHAMAFCQWLTARERAAGRLPAGYQYRLPTEAEWEYACRAGSESDFAGSVADMAWSALTTPDRRNHPVARRQPNAWGLFDMHGNVWEWCLDWQREYSEIAATDPHGPSEGVFKVIRGGSWENAATMCRSANRGSKAVPELGPNLGFRVVLGVEVK